MYASIGEKSLQIQWTGVKRCVTLRMGRSTAVYFYVFPALRTQICWAQQSTDDILHQLIIKAFMNQNSQTPVASFHVFTSGLANVQAFE